MSTRERHKRAIKTSDCNLGGRETVGGEKTRILVFGFCRERGGWLILARSDCVSVLGASVSSVVGLVEVSDVVHFTP